MRVRLNRRSRAAALWAFAFFASGQLALGLLLDYRYPLVRFPSGAQVLAVAAAEPRPPTVVFFGSSRTGAGLDLERVNAILKAESGHEPAPRAVTQAVPCGDALTAEFQLERLLEIGKKPRWAVIEVSPETLNEHNLWMAAHTVRQLNWGDVPSHWRAARRGHAGWYFIESRLVPAYTHRKQLVYEARTAIRGWLPLPAPKLVKSDGPLDWGALLPPTDRPPDDELVRQLQVGVDTTIRRWLHPFDIDGVSPAALERVLARCRAEGIRVVLLGIPQCSAHRAVTAGPIDAEYRAYIDHLTRKFGCRFVDAHDWSPDTDFLDTLHLRSDGARGLTERLTREVLLKLPSGPE
jgi:hypothetical protein